MPHEFVSTLNRLIDLRVDEWAVFLATHAGGAARPTTAVETRLSVAAHSD